MLEIGFCCIADCHVDIRGMRPGIPMRDTIYGLEQVVEYCLSHEKPLVIAGDLFDKSLPPSYLVNRVTDILERLSVGGPGVWLIQGNHDKDPSFPWGCHARGVKWLGLTPEVVGGHALVGIDFLPAGLISQALTRIPRCDGLVIHQALRQGLGFEGAWNCDLDWVSSDLTHNVWVGDLHRVLDELWSTDHRVRALYTGSQYMTTVDESPTPSFLDVGPRGDPHPEYARVPLRHRAVLEFSIEDEQQLEQAIERATQALASPDDALPEELQSPVFVVRYRADLQRTHKAFSDLCAGGLGHVIELPQASGSRSCDVAKVRIQAEQGLTLPLLVDRAVPKEREPDLNAFVKELSLCTSPEQPPQVLAAWKIKTTSRS